MINRAQEALLNGTFLNEFSPVPEDLKIVAGRLGADDNPDQLALVAKEEANLAKYGAKNWYDYCIRQWGTKWDVDCDSVNINEEGVLTASYQSAWAPPVPFYDTLEEMGFSVIAYYDEPGMAFAGVYSEGVDDYFEYGGMSSEEAREYLPEVLDDCFGITESIAEYEESEAE
jgi:hypothetical protein